MLEEFIAMVVTYCIDILELIGIFIIIFSGIKTFYRYIMTGFDAHNHQIKLDFARSLAFALEFKLAGEILRTVITKTIGEMYVLAAIIVLRTLLTFVIHYEIKFDTDSSVMEKELEYKYGRKKHRKSSSSSSLETPD